MPVRWISDWRARELHSKAQRLDHAGTRDEALRLYRRALEIDPDRPTTLYNIGLIHKYRLNWRESFDFNARAYALNPQDEATRWNYAIAATALRDWATARQLWKENGIDIGEGEGPIEMDLGMTPLRLNPDTDGEVVWGTRIDPARARIRSVPFAESGYRHGDVVLNDGAPVGSRMFNGSKRAVF
ncbi:MAG TPA: tetratricopeptide repeat protein, partial [Gammaproteobacteria bacterium]|nr:tetratricopeptide repeat protein [Gammaproteobacteria bacterium]